MNKQQVLKPSVSMLIRHDPSLKLNVYKSGQKRLAPAIKKEMKRRTAIEPVIGHMTNARLSAVGYNFRLLLKWFRFLYAYFCLNIFYSNLA